MPLRHMLRVHLVNLLLELSEVALPLLFSRNVGEGYENVHEGIF